MHYSCDVESTSFLRCLCSTSLRLDIMDAMGLQFPVNYVGGGSLRNTYIRSPENIGNNYLSSIRGIQGLSCTKRTRLTDVKRPKRVVATAAADMQAVESARENGVPGTSSVVEKRESEHETSHDDDDDDTSAKFNWNKQWYPVAVVKDLEKDAPTAATILGRPLAIWWDRGSAKWQVYADQCPHRMAPLSEGSISDDGHLRCSYHGWTFQGDSGHCTFIPQAPKDAPPAHTLKRACASVYPSMEQQGIIWFWPDLSQGPINMEAAANPPPLFPEMEDPTYEFNIASRDLEYGYDTLVENLVDPAHVPFAHHKIQGNRDYASPLNYKITTEITPEGFKGEDERSKVAFYAPCVFTLAFTLPQNLKRVPGTSIMSQGVNYTLNRKAHRKPKNAPPKKISLMLLCVPISPGRSRLIWSFPRNFATFFINRLPPWIAHVTNNLVFDSDMYLLHLQERRMEHEGSRNWSKLVYTPTKADILVHGFRRWFNKFAGGAPDWAGRFPNQLPPSPPKRFILDRYHQHVVNCKSCRNALKNFKALEVGLQVLAIALVGLVAASAVIVPLRPVGSFAIPLVIGAVLSTILSRWLANFIYKSFYFHDYNHASVK